ncbi:MAG TPA: hypothetical protein VNS50_13060 [Ginsengibacter sp.]|nr:hypothetical protein [Ginsengibacter sp.]
MAKRLILIVSILMTVLIFSCSKKTHPSKTSSESVVKTTDTTATTKPVTKTKTKVPLPKVIVVNDSAAHKSVDGRLYYDMMGHRYWRNNKDGKYYLFNKSMYNNPDFNKPS